MRLIVLLAFCWVVLAGCSGMTARAGDTEPVGATSTGIPVATSTREAAPTATAFPRIVAPTLLPTANLAPTGVPTPDPETPPRVGIQVGHWKIEEHPDEQARLRKFSGAYYGGYDEWELNIIIAEQVRDLLTAGGVVAELIPATVPVGYTADAFVSIHVDGVTGEQAVTRRGWKVATPFRASAASQLLAAAIAESYPAATGLPADAQGPSYDMRAYYAFASYRYWHSIAPTTPAVIVECGFMTHPEDRSVLFDQSGRVAVGIARGVLNYLEAYHPASPELRAEQGGGMLRPAVDGTPLHRRADADSAVDLRLRAEQRLVPVAKAGAWLLVFTHGGAWDLGWVAADAVVETNEPLKPPHPRP